MAKFEINEAALREVAQDAIKKAVTQVDRDMNSYRGQPVQQAKPALERAMRRHGLQPDIRSSDFQRMVEVINAGGHLR